MWHVYDIIGKGSQNNDFVQNKTVISYKNSASERNESLLSNCRAQPVLFKNSASDRNESLLSKCRTQPVLLKKTFLLSSRESVYGPAENIVRTDMKSHARKSGQLFWFM